MLKPEGPPTAPTWFEIYDVEGWFYATWRHGDRWHNTEYFATPQEAEDAAEAVMATQGRQTGPPSGDTSERMSNTTVWGKLIGLW